MDDKGVHVTVTRPDTWQEVKDAAMSTIGKTSSKYPSTEWKTRMLFAEHSPIRQLVYKIRFENIPYYVAMHLVRHKVGVEHYVSTQREDRTGEDRAGKPQDAPVTLTMTANAQAVINISRKRLCNQAHPETRKAWAEAVRQIITLDPEMRAVCVPECVYRGFCPEFNPCGGYMGREWVLAELEQARTC